MPKILITNTLDKNEAIKRVREDNPFEQIKFYTINELQKNYPYTYTTKTLEYICQKENVILDVAKIYLSTICIYPVENLNNEKGKFLTALKQDLLTQKLLLPNTLLKNFLKKSEIILENIHPTKQIQNLLKEFPNVSFCQNKTDEKFTPIVYECENIEEEITLIGEKIITLLHEGIDINHIYLKNVSDEYLNPLKRIFRLLNIPLYLKPRTTLLQIPLVSNFLNLYKNDEQQAYSYLEKMNEEKENQEIIALLINVINTYVDLKEKVMFITNDLSTRTIKSSFKENCVREKELKEKTNDQDYIFILGFNNNIPHTFKDEDYITDEEKKFLGYDTAEELNKIEKEEITNMIYHSKNTVITYKKNHAGKECYPSPLLENLEKKKEEIKLNVSHEYNKFLLASLLDEYVKYNTISPTLLNLLSTYSLPYQTYDEQFTGISKERLYTYLKNKLTLSYTSLDTFNKCSFEYFLNNILHLDPLEETFNIKIGNLFHKVLERIHEEEFDFDYIYEHEIKEEIWNEKEIFFLEKLKEDFKFVVTTIIEQEKYSSLKEIQTEVPVTIKIPSKLDVTFKGKIDKLSYAKVNKHTVINITDYKTGSTSVIPAYYPIGLNLQLPVYLYLASKMDNLDSIIIGGFYLQKILLPKIKYDAKKNYETQKKENLKLQGYSNPNKEILELVDNEYKNSHIIAGLKEKKDGDFYHTSKLLDEETVTKMSELIEKNITDCIKNIEEANFKINPKVVDNKENVSCKFCPYKDICYHTSKDITYVNSVKDFLKKEANHGLDE